MDPTTTAHSSAIHHSQIHTSTAADGTPILTTGPMTPSLDFDPSGFKRADTNLGPSLANPYTNPAPLVPDNHSLEHANPHPVVAKSAVDIGSGDARPAETHANTGSASHSLNTGSSTVGANVPNSSGTSSTGTTGSAPTVTGLRQRAGSISNTVGAKVNAVGSNVGAQLNSVTNTVGNQLNHAAEHPAVQNAKQGAVQQVNSFREVLGRYPIIVNAEKRTGVDRVALVAGGVFAYLLLIPLNLFGLALPTTQLLTFLPPTFLALRTLDNPNEERTKTLLSYFVVFGFVQFAESLMAGFLERRIPQYYTVKLLFLAYLIHPRTKGARKIHAQVLRPLLARAQQAQKHSAQASYNTPPTTKPSSGPTVNSPTFPAQSNTTATDVPLTRTSGFSGTGPSSTGHAGAPASAGTGSGFHSIDASGFPNSGAQGFNVGPGQIHLPSGGGNGVGQEVPKY